MLQLVAVGLSMNLNCIMVGRNGGLDAIDKHCLRGEINSSVVSVNGHCWPRE